MMLRTTVLSMLLVASSFLSCQQEQSTTPPKTEPGATSIAKQAEAECTIVDFPVWSTTANMWVRNYHEVCGDHNKQLIPADSLNKLHAFHPNSKYVRVYYLLENGSSHPSIAMVNVAAGDCYRDKTPDNLPQVLVATSDETYFTTADDVQPLILAWKAHLDTMPEYAPVYGYNYRWQLAADLANVDGHLAVVHALHSISRYDNNYCIPHDPMEMGTMEGFLAHDLVLAAANDTALKGDAYDFSMPCPQFCGDLVADNGQACQ